MKKNELPKIVYVANIIDRADGTYSLIAYDNANEFAFVGEDQTVGVYRLDRVVTVTAEPIIKINDKK